jgi:hydroxymethylpyrimidine/phosphomethylpyrimidine kinase
MTAPPIILTIAGFDPSSGAGVTADIKTIAAHGCYGVACVTALTVQSTCGVRRVEPLSPRLVGDTLQELAADVEIAAVRIGMLGSRSVAEAVGEFFRKHKQENVVLDPILKSSSGAQLLEDAGLAVLREKLFPLVSVITPNLHEASVLTGEPVTTLDHMRAAARKLHAMGAAAVVVTAGDLQEATEVLSVTNKGAVEQEVFRSDRQHSTSTHGTGCAFAAALACQLAQNRSLSEGVRLAKAFVSAAIANAYPLGRGIGPLNHLYGFQEERR